MSRFGGRLRFGRVKGTTIILCTGVVMSLSPHRVSLVQLADTFIMAATLVSAAACYHAPLVTPQTGVEGQPLQSLSNQGFHRFPGVDVVPMNRGAFIVRIHSGLVGSGQPLYVIDGAPITLSTNRGIDWFKPEDISQIRVLTSPDELAIYGPQGVNGVILITTKQAATPVRGY
jgi:TonB-dependent SusC/RagA subfamily outer membrane receptor